MFCEKCGNRLEPGDVFCPECGTRVTPMPAAPAGPQGAQGNYTPANNSAWQVPAKKSGLSGLGSGGLSGSLSGAMSGGIANFITAILGVLMLIWTFLPFISINLGKLGELASMFDEAPDLSKLKFNLYEIRTTIKQILAWDMDGQYKWVSVVVTLIVIYVVLVALMAIASGVLNTKGLLLTSGVMSSVCLIIWIVYMIVVAHYKGVILSEIDYEFGLDASSMMPSIHGIGLYLMIITLAAHAFLSIRKATQM